MEENAQSKTSISFVTVRIPRSKRRRLRQETALPFAAAAAPLGLTFQHELPRELAEAAVRTAFQFLLRQALPQDQHAKPTASLGSLPSSVQAQRRERRLLRTFCELDAGQKGFLDEQDLERYALDNDLPVEYIPAFQAAVLQWSNAKADTPINFERFRRFVTSRETSLLRTFRALDADGNGELTFQEIAARLGNICYTCPTSRCSYKCNPMAVKRLLTSLGEEGSTPLAMSFRDFRKLFLLLPQTDMLVDYWLCASAPSLCDIGSCVTVRDATARGSPWGHLFAGAAAGAASRTATAPLETLRLQAMTGAGTESSPIAAARKIVKSAGWGGLYRGNLLNVLRSAPQKALDFFAFDLYKEMLGAKDSGDLLPTFVAAGLAGATSTAVLHPLEVLRSRVTCDVTGQYSNLAQAAGTLVRQEGVRSLYRGLGPSVLAILPEAAITYGMFDMLKRGYTRLVGREETGVVPSVAFGVLSAFTGQMVAFPLESVARRLQVQKASATNVGFLAIIREILRKEGPLSLYRGVGAGAMRVVPMAFVSFSTYEVVRHWVILLEEAQAQQRATRSSCKPAEELSASTQPEGVLAAAAVS